jgi:hydrogenase maturation protease
MAGYWEELERPAPDAVRTSGGSELRAGVRVRLRPRAGGDVFDIALAGRDAMIEAIEQDLEGRTTVAVVLDDDPGRDLGFARQPGHRFFFAPSELEVLDDAAGSAAGGRADEANAALAARRVLVAGIGNVFLGDDGFGVALADRLARRRLPAGAEVVDFGIRGMDLAFAIQDGYDAVVLLDATPRGETPGTLYVIEIDADEEAEMTAAPSAHGMDPVQVIGLVRSFGGTLPRIYVVGCEPRTQMSPDDQEIVAELSAPVHAALDHAVRLVESLCEEILTPEPFAENRSGANNRR